MPTTNDRERGSGAPPRRRGGASALPQWGSSGRPVLDLAEVTIRREKGGSSFVLRIPKFRVSPGEFVAVVGQSGCGKSTLLDVLGLILAPTEAERFLCCDVSGDVVALHEGASDGRLAAMRRTQIGYVLQTGGLLPFLSVQKNIELPRKINGMRGNADAAKRLAKSLGIDSQLGKLPQHLSGGQRQRAAIARALSHQPPIILADEPTAAVDRPNALEILSHFKSLVRRLGMTLLMVTHDLELVRESADRFLTFDVKRLSETRVESTCHEVGRTQV